MQRRKPLGFHPQQPSSLSVESVLRHPIVLIVWTIFCIVAGVQLIRSGVQARQVLEKKNEAEEVLRKEEQTGVELIQKLKEASSPTNKERIIREELRLQKPGEVILQVPTPTPGN